MVTGSGSGELQVSPDHALKLVQDASMLMGQILQQITSFQSTPLQPSWGARVGSGMTGAATEFNSSYTQALTTLVKFFDELHRTLSQSVQSLKGGDQQQSQALQGVLSMLPTVDGVHLAATAAPTPPTDGDPTGGTPTDGAGGGLDGAPTPLGTR